MYFKCFMKSQNYLVKIDCVALEVSIMIIITTFTNNTYVQSICNNTKHLKMGIVNAIFYL